MVWKVKSKEPEVEEVQEVDLDLENSESEIQELTRKIKELENRKKVPEIKPKREEDTGLNKQEVIDAIQGNLSRASQLIELLRR